MRQDKTELHLYLIRHAESAANTQPHLIGGRNPETPLTDLGKRQAEALAVRFAAREQKIDRLYASPFRRALETVMPLASHLGLPCAYRDALVEFSQGAWEGRPRADVWTPDTRQRMADKHFDFAAPGGESQRMVQRRASGWLEEELLEHPSILGADHPVHIAVVSHGITIKTLIQYITGVDRSFVWRMRIDNTSVSKFVYRSRGWFQEYVNDTSHLLAL